jgi:hypothetical protein
MLPPSELWATRPAVEPKRNNITTDLPRRSLRLLAERRRSAASLRLQRPADGDLLELQSRAVRRLSVPGLKVTMVVNSLLKTLLPLE